MWTQCRSPERWKAYRPILPVVKSNRMEPKKSINWGAVGAIATVAGALSGIWATWHIEVERALARGNAPSHAALPAAVDGVPAGSISVTKPPPRPPVALGSYPVQVVKSKHFTFRLENLQAVGADVAADIEIDNRTRDDRTLVVQVTADKLANAGTTGLPPCTIIGPDATSFASSAASLANQSGSQDGQESFTIFANTTPVLHLTFAGAATLTRAEWVRLSLGEPEGNSKLGLLSIAFKDAPVVGAD